MIEGNGIAVLIDGPVNHETRFLGVGQVVHITLTKERLEPIGARAITHVDGGIGQPRTPEGELRFLPPQGPVRLAMEGVAPNISLGITGVIAGPVHILDIVDERPFLVGNLDFILIWLIVGHLEAVLAPVIVRTLDFVPFVAITGYAVAVHIHAHHNNARLAAAARLIGHSLALNGVTVDFNVVAVLIDYRMIKAKDDVTAKTPQADGSTNRFSAQRCLDQRIDAVLSIAGLIGRKLVHELTRSGQIVINMGNVRRILGICRPSRHHSQNEK